MDTLQYQKKLAEYDERIAFEKVKMDQIEHEKARFVLDVMNATLQAQTKETLNKG